MTDYYDVTLKQRRHALLCQHERFTATEAMLEDTASLHAAVVEAQSTLSAIGAGWQASVHDNRIVSAWRCLHSQCPQPAKSKFFGCARGVIH